MAHRRLPLAFALVAAALPAAAGEPRGIGFAQAEEGTWWCHGDAAGATLDCARRRCVAEAGGRPCVVTRWCSPAGWSVLMVTWLPEFHATQVICGMPGREAASAAAEAACAAGAEFSRCDLVLVIDPEGGQTAVTDVSWPGGAALATPPAGGE